MTGRYAAGDYVEYRMADGGVILLKVLAVGVSGGGWFRREKPWIKVGYAEMDWRGALFVRDTAFIPVSHGHQGEFTIELDDKGWAWLGGVPLVQAFELRGVPTLTFRTLRMEAAFRSAQEDINNDDNNAG